MPLVHIPPQPHHIRFQKVNVRRKPHWRYALAVDFDVTHRDPEVRQDPWIGRTWQVVDHGFLLNRTAKHDAIQTALDIWFDDSPLRWELESRILADEEQTQLAEAMELPLLVIQAYEAIFFDVRAYLAKRDYIAGTVLQVWKPFEPTDVGRIWGHRSYFGGLPVLETVVDHFDRRGWKDYRPLLVEPAVAGRSALDAAIERDLLLTFVPQEVASAALACAAAELLRAQQAAAARRPVAEPAEIPEELVEACEAIVAEAMRCSPSQQKSKAV